MKFSKIRLVSPLLAIASSVALSADGVDNLLPAADGPADESGVWSMVGDELDALVHQDGSPVGQDNGESRKLRRRLDGDRVVGPIKFDAVPGKCLTKHFTSDLSLWTCNGGTNQQFYYHKTDMAIRLAASSRTCLESRVSSAGVEYTPWPCGSDDLKYKWYMDAGKRIRSMLDTNKCLEAQGTDLKTATCADTNVFQWVVVPTDFFPLPDMQFLVNGQWSHCMSRKSDADVNNNACHASQDYHNWRYHPYQKQIKHVHSGSCLTKDGNKLVIQTCDDETRSHQRWMWDNKLRLKSYRDLNQCVEIINNAYEMKSCDDDRMQQKIMPPIGFFARHSPKEHGALQFRSNGYCLTVDSDDVNVKGQDCSRGEWFWGKQQWYYNKGDKTIRSKHNDKCLEVHKDDNLNIRLNDCKSNWTNQQWYMEAGGRLKSVRWGYTTCMDLRSGSPHNVYMYDCHGRDNQKLVYPKNFFKDV